MKTTPMNQSKIDRRDAMKRGIGAAALAALGGGAAVSAALSTASILAAADTGNAHTPDTMSRVTEPATGITMHAGYARTIAQMAYVWGWPIVNMINRGNRI